ncbi:hypothetical protein IFM89_008589 [Coptis chinensis]|uniref:UBA domain-containing protein n=1 Tax=Coptis chinensis TaxID=261450 RepID=A0A835LYZ2_9MAGN|nr:hypothetical protein IFM89_008589 [Coptis chinensis]
MDGGRLPIGEAHENERGWVIGQVAYREWKCQYGIRKEFYQKKKKVGSSLSLLYAQLHCLWILSYLGIFVLSMASSSSQLRSITERMGMFSICCHVMMELSYDCFRDTFQARYPSHYSTDTSDRAIVHWDRIRAQPIDIPPNNVHASDCLDKLHPGDHVEIQWRGNKELPYGWWYGVVGHLETCGEIRSLCHCQKSDPSLNMLASGPYGLIFSSFVPFYFGIRVSTRFRIFGINFSNKSFVYLAGLQVTPFLVRKRSILPGICGVLAVLLYRSNILGVRRIKFPEFVSSFVSRLSWPTLGGSSPPASGGNVIGNIPSYTGHEVEASTGNYPSVAPASTVEPSDNSIGTLVSMGFDRNSARQALVQARNDVNVATNILLEAQSH